MNIRALTFSFCFAAMPIAFVIGDDRPALRESPERLVKVIDSTARANYTAACVNVTRDAAQNRLRIYAVSQKAKAGIYKKEGFEIEVIYHPGLQAENGTAAGPYHQHYNHLVLRFAAAQFTAGRKGLGLQLVRLLARAQPEMSWSSPTHTQLTIQKILKGLEKDEESVRQFLKEESEEWEYILKTYK